MIRSELVAKLARGAGRSPAAGGASTVAALLAAAVAGLPLPAAGQDSLTVTVVATTDVHGRATHWDYVGDVEAPWGLTRAAAVIDSLRERGELVVLVDAGDLLQGNAFAAFYAAEGRRDLHPVIDAVNALRYDVITPGNHEFDFGVPFLDSALAGVQARVVSGNIRRPDYGGSAFREFTVLERGPLRVGVTGFTTPGTMVWNRARVAGREVRPILPEAERVMGALRREGVDLEIAVVHSGMSGGSSYDTTGVGAENVAAGLAGLPTPPDLVVVGHSHRTMTDSVVNGVHFVQPPPWARGLAVARARFARGADGAYVLAGIDAEQVSLADVPPDPEVARRLDDAHRRARSWANTTLATNRGEWSGRFARTGDSPLVDFVNEVQRRAAGAQLSAAALFDPSAVFPAGEVRRRHVMGLYPYENTLKAVRIDGATLRAYLERSAAYFRTYEPGGPILDPRVPGYDFDMVSGVDYVVDLSRPAGSRIRQLGYRGRLVEPDDVFTLAVNSYRQGGGGGYDMLAGLPVVHDGGENIRDLLVRELSRVGALDSGMYYERSWRVIPEDAARAARVAFGEPDPRTVERTAARVLATTDWYGAIRPIVTPWSEGRPVGGALALAAWEDSLSSACGCAGVRLDVGDQLTGSLAADHAFGAPVVRVMNALGLDATVLGPRDLRWGLDTLRRRVQSAAYPWLGANVRHAGAAERPSWLRDWIVIERGGLAIAVIGVTFPEGGERDTDAAVLAIDEPLDAVRRVLPRVRAAAPDFVIVAAHGAAACEAGACHGELIDLVESLEPGEVDLVVGGHSDTEARAVINGISVLLPGSYGLSLGVADLIVGGAAGRRVALAVETLWADSPVPDSALAEALGDLPRDDEALVTMKFAAPAPAGGESAIGRLVADAYRNATRAQIALVPNDHLRAGLPAGRITRHDAYRVQPVQHALRRMTVPGSTIVAMLERALAEDLPTANVSGVLVWYDPEAEPGRRVRRVEFPDGERLRGDRPYTLGVSDLVARGGLGFAALAEHPSEDAGASDFDALVTYLMRLGNEVEAPERPRYRYR